MNLFEMYVEKCKADTTLNNYKQTLNRIYNIAKKYTQNPALCHAETKQVNELLETYKEALNIAKRDHNYYMECEHALTIISGEFSKIYQILNIPQNILNEHT